MDGLAKTAAMVGEKNRVTFATKRKDKFTDSFHFKFEEATNLFYGLVALLYRVRLCSIHVISYQFSS